MICGWREQMQLGGAGGDYTLVTPMTQKSNIKKQKEN